MKNKILISLLVVLISIIYGLPNIILISKLGSNYTPFTLSGKSPIARDETYAYAPFVNYILQGHLFLKDIYVAEYAKYPTPFMGESAPAIIFAVLAKVTGSTENAFIAADFIFPPIIFLLLHIVAQFFIRNRLYALASAFVATVARDLIAVIPYPHETIQYLTVAEGQNYLLYFSRAFHPQLTFIFLTLGLIAVAKLAENPRTKKYIIASGITFGILFYSYVFYWTYFVVFFGFAYFYFLARREKENILALTAVGLIALMIAFPYLLNTFQFYQLDKAGDFIAKSSLANVPLPLALIRYLIITLIFFIFSKKKDNKFFVFLLFLMAGILITPASKLVLGQDLETFHYLRRALMPFATIAFFVSVYWMLKNRNRLTKFLSIVLFIVFILFAINAQVIASEKIQSSHIRNLDEQKVFAWLNANAPKWSVVGSVDEDFEPLIPVYTADFVYFPPTDRTITSTSEGVTRYAILASILGLDKSWQKKNLDNIVSYIFIYQSYDNNLNLDLNSPKRVWAEGEIERVSNNWPSELNRFKLDYVVVTPKENQIVKPQRSFLTEIAAFGDYKIYQYKSR